MDSWATVVSHESRGAYIKAELLWDDLPVFKSLPKVASLFSLQVKRGVPEGWVGAASHILHQDLDPRTWAV